MGTKFREADANGETTVEEYKEVPDGAAQW